MIGNWGQVTTVRQELCGFNSSDRVLDQEAEFITLLIADRSPEILDFDEVLADENHLGNFRDASHPRVA